MLTVLTFLPFAAGGLILLLPRRRDSALRFVADSRRSGGPCDRRTVDGPARADRRRRPAAGRLDSIDRCELRARLRRAQRATRVVDDAARTAGVVRPARVR